MAPKDTRPQQNRTTDPAADGRPNAHGWPSYADAAEQLRDNGYEPVPIIPGAKHPPMRGWSSMTIDESQIEAWSRQYPHFGIGLRTGRLVGIDIDILDPDIAQEIHHLAVRRFGETLLRVGLWPKRLLLYRIADPMPKISAGKIEILGLGQQVVALGMHPATQAPYRWPLGETPLEVAHDDLPAVDGPGLHGFLAEAKALLPDQPTGARRTRGGRGPGGTGAAGIQRENGLVVDGRDAWLSTIAYHTVLDSRDAGEALDLDRLADRVWERFAASTDLDRPKAGGQFAYTLPDARRKVADKLRLLRDGRLSERDRDPVEPGYDAPDNPVLQARQKLDEALGDVCQQIEMWHGERTGPPPRIGIRATVGLGKSVRAREHLLALRKRLLAAGMPARVLVVTPSHALADEAARGWQEAGVRTAVLRGYEATDPRNGQPMCRDLEAVRAAISAGVDVQKHACAHGRHRCPHLSGCAKQANRMAVSEADVVFAAYDVLFTGLAGIEEGFGVILIDEGCWARAVHESDAGCVENLVSQMGGFPRREAGMARMADLVALRERAHRAMTANGPGPMRRSALIAAGLSAGDCRDASGLEARRQRNPGLRPGLSPALRQAAFQQAHINARVRRAMVLWHRLADLLDGSPERTGRVVIGEPDPKTGVHRIVTRGVRSIHPDLRDAPILHLDATLRPPVARTILPGLEMTEIGATAPHMYLTLVSGRFGKGTICPDDRSAEEETRRRQNRLREVVDHVRWQARRVAPGRTLVITHQALERAFEGIPGVETAHFNAIAGLDCWRDISLLIVIGRPLPPETTLRELTGALFGHWPADSATYRSERRGVHMRDGTIRAVKAIAHEDEKAEILRAAICDDELIQAIGRGRGVNRTADTPLEVQVLADVALPLVHDCILAWEAVKPDILQRMLLAGIAVDRPADASVLHPTLFANEKQAQKAFERVGFKRHSPLRDTYREMSLKSAAYRKSGRGHAWARCWWIDGDADAACETLTRAIGTLGGWRPGGC